jgi:uncharacterized protein
VPERLLDGIHISDAPQAEQPIEPALVQATAFIGRTLRGPLHSPVVVRSFADFQQIFGGLWQPSPLSYAVEHFFEQGGRQAVIVRVANAAAPATLSLRCGQETLYLQARAPGTREFLRASVDYDHIDGHDLQRFNLVIQRVRSPGSERVDEQESFRGLSMDPSAPRFIARALLESKLVSVRGTVPAERPDRTLVPGTNMPVGYVSSNPDGDDGVPITDYDVIGSATHRTGLFALGHADDIGFVYIPPLSRTADIGASALLVAARFCRSRRAMLIVDPLAGWETPAAALAGLKALNFYSENAVMFYPRIVATDRLRGRSEIFGNGGAVAGLLSRYADAVAAAIAPSEPAPVLRVGSRLACEIGASDRVRLANHGINVLQSVRTAERNRPPLRTLAGGAGASADWSYLAQRRFALFVVNAIEHGTRWAAAAPKDQETWMRVRQQVQDFLQELRDVGAFAAASHEQAFVVVCDERINDNEETGVHILVQFAANHCGDYHSYMITQSLSGASVRPVSMRRIDRSLLIAPELERETTIRMPAAETRRKSEFYVENTDELPALVPAPDIFIALPGTRTE